LAEQLAVRILQPLGLGGTTFPTLPQLPAPAPTPYGVDMGSGVISEYPLISPTSLAGAGAMTSTLAVLLTWGDELGSGSLVGPTLHELRRTRSRAVTNGPEYARYGLGIGEIDGWWGHTGSALGFQAAAFYDPRTGTVIAAIVNASPLDDTPRYPDDEDRLDPNIAEEIFIELEKVASA
jgi:D-alanyl-D-alanine carboxypeptidase